MNTGGLHALLDLGLAVGVFGFAARLWRLRADFAAKLRTHEAKARRLGDLYAALSRTNQLIVREHDPQTLLEEICRICVETGHAHLTIVNLIDGDHAIRVATAGPAVAAFFAGVPLRWDLTTAASQASTTLQAMRSGVRAVCQDYQNDPRARAYRERAIATGIRSMAAFPIKRGGKVIGTLQLYEAELAYFDDALLGLIDELVADVAFALENIDREIAAMAAREETLASHEQFRRLFKSAPAAYVITSLADLRIVEVNDAVCELYGLSAEQMIGKRWRTDLHVGLIDEDVARYYEVLRTEGRVRSMEVRVRSSAGVIRTSLMNAETLDYLGQDCVISMSVDVTDLRKEERAREAQATAEAANHAKTEFLSRMSHELRTPLNAVLGFSQLLQNDAQERLTALDHSRLTYIHRAGRYLLGLVNDVLDVSSIEAGRIEVRNGAVALLPLLDEAFQIGATLARQTGVELIADYAQNRPLEVFADAGRLRQVVINLMSNAIKYNRAGGSVSVLLSRAGGRVSIDVVDTGMGMTAEQLAHLYEPFNRLGRERGGIDGTGIGLALTRQLVRLMQGELTIQSEIGRGTRATVNLAHADTSSQATPAPSAACAHVAIEPPRKVFGTVLYVEDNEVNVMLVEQMLAHLPEVRLVCASDGKKGIEQALKLTPDLILLDMQLPDMSGLDVLRSLRSDPATRSLTVVALSASAMPAEVSEARAEGLDDYWTKPLDFNEFVAGVARLLVRDRVAT